MDVARGLKSRLKQKFRAREAQDGSESSLEPPATTTLPDATAPNVALQSDKEIINKQSDGSRSPVVEENSKWIDRGILFLNVAQGISESSDLLAPLKAACGATITLLESINSSTANQDAWSHLVTSIKRHQRALIQQLGRLEMDKATLGNASQLMQLIEDYQRRVDSSRGDVSDALFRVLAQILGEVFKESSVTEEDIHGTKLGLRRLMTRIGTVELEAGAIASLYEQLKEANSHLMTALQLYVASETTETKEMLGNVQSLLMNSTVVTVNLRHGNQHDRCLEGTRVAILSQLEQWGRDLDSQHRIFFLGDVAGKGKSTVAKEMVCRWEEQGMLAARFFFSRGQSGGSTAGDFIRHVAADLSRTFKPIRRQIHSALQDHAILTKPFATRWKTLIEEPLRQLQGSYTIVVDGLDECSQEGPADNRTDTRENLLEAILGTFTATLPVRILIASRREEDIELALRDAPSVYSTGVQTAPGQEHLNTQDLERFVSFQFTHMSFVGFTTQDVQELVSRSDGLFIFASTACGLLRRSKARKALLKEITTSEAFSGLDGLYLEILKRSAPDKPSLRVIIHLLGVVLAARETLTSRILLNFLDEVEDVEGVTHGLASVLYSGGMDDPVYIIHPTFREFLFQTNRAAEFMVDVMDGHGRLVLASCRTLSNELKFDMCGVTSGASLTPLNKEIIDLPERVVRSTSSSLRYAVAHMIEHAVFVPEYDGIVSRLSSIFDQKLLEWLEAVFFCSAFSPVMASLMELQRVLGDIHDKQAGTLRKWCSETVELVKSYQHLLRISFIQIHFSVLTFSPRNGLIFSHYYERAPVKLPIAKGQSFASNDRTLVLRGHNSVVNCVAYSSKAALLASGSRDKTVKVWDAQTGALLYTLEGHQQEVKSLAFANDDKHLLSGSMDGTMIKWDPHTGHSVGKGMDLRSGWIWSIKVAAKRCMVVCGTNEGTCGVHPESGEILWTCSDADQMPVTAVALSSDEELLVSASYGKTVTLWKVSSPPSSIRTLTLDNNIYDLTFVPNTSRVCIAAQYLCLWDIESGKEIYRTEDERQKHIVVSSNGETILAVGSSLVTRIWDTKSGKLLSVPPHGHNSATSCLAYSPDGTTYVTGSTDRTLRVHRVGTEPTDSHKDSVPAEIRTISISQDASLVVSVDRLCRMKVWDGTTGELLRGPFQLEVETDGYYTSQVAILPGGDHVVYHWHDEAGVWSTIDGTKLKTVNFGEEEILQMSISHDGCTLALWKMASFDIWDIKDILASDPTLLATVQGKELDQAGYQSSDVVAFHPSDDFLAMDQIAWVIRPLPARPVEPVDLARVISETFPILYRWDQEHKLDWVDLGRPVRMSIAIPGEFDINAHRGLGTTIALGAFDGRMIILDCEKAMKGD
ncbi:related to F-box and wd40 domain protein, putative-Talaromyces stipitatus [Serendipita indica DSM 11827]|uniref:Related to F-box and wd40 domain protein, putative-Talaromyces stipitatus n=1 Tax=Serendipita indica (strain DSM 11827) TaxID=1109443 RepID=G4TUT2_SERID|nr:related to F-box and wd40 domain protein, putative-Talaromyces stipitatus [Serendipita indica DSM 11827]